MHLFSICLHSLTSLLFVTMCISLLCLSCQGLEEIDSSDKSQSAAQQQGHLSGTAFDWLQVRRVLFDRWQFHFTKGNLVL